MPLTKPRVAPVLLRSLYFLIGLGLSLGALQCSGCTSAPQVLYQNRLESLDGLLTKDGVTVETAARQGRRGIRIETHGPTLVGLAEVQTKAAESVVLTYRGHLRAADLRGHAYLEMRCNIPGKGDLVSGAVDIPLAGTSDWVTQVTRLSLGRQQRAQTVKLNVQIEGSGVVWVSNILLAQAPR